MSEARPVVVTGARGFIGMNLCCRLREASELELRPLSTGCSQSEMAEALEGAQFVFHLAGVNRAEQPEAFFEGNVGFTRTLCDVARDRKDPPPIAFTSSIHAGRDTPYGASKEAAEVVLREYGMATGAPVHLLRLPGVFGKWGRPDYNSVVATFCHNIARGLPITVRDPAALLTLVHIDDVVSTLFSLLRDNHPGGYVNVAPVYETTVGALADLLRSYSDGRRTLAMPPVGTGFQRALYATYASYLPSSGLAYQVRSNSDERGEFVELLKTADSGQFSYFTILPGKTRGGHYHHTKTEKFLVASGDARFDFRNVLTNEACSVFASGGMARIVEAAPGWAHSVTNVGTREVVCLVWANETFDPARPDTFAARTLP